jgi:uncharacterized membrane protein
MKPTYNVLAAQSLERLAALSDGVFAIAMTLLVLDLRIDYSEPVASERDLWHVLAKLAPQFIAYLMSFMTLGIFWVGQQAQISRFARSNRDLTWIHIAFLLTISLMPFSTALLAHYITFRVALLTYWLNIVLAGGALYVSWRFAKAAGLLKDDTTPEMSDAVERRIIVAQSLYAAGAALCIINTYASIAAIVLIQLNYAIAPRIRALYRI